MDSRISVGRPRTRTVAGAGDEVLTNVNIVYRMRKSSVSVDERLVRRLMQRYRLATAEHAVDFALRALVGDPRDMLDLKGAGWDGDLEEIRQTRI